MVSYLPKNKPGIVKIPRMNYIVIRGKGNPNDENSEYKVYTTKIEKAKNKSVLK